MELKTILRCALADLQGMVEEIDPSGDRVHPAWTTIREIEQLVNRYDMDNTLNTMAQIENFILWYASDEALRDKLLTAAEQYVSEVLPSEEVCNED